MSPVWAIARGNEPGSERSLDVCLSLGCSFIYDSNTTFLALPLLVPGPPQMCPLSELATPSLAKATPQMAKQFSHQGKEGPAHTS